MDLRILLGLAFVAAASAAPLTSTQCARQCEGVQPFETQKTYQYSYSVETATFVNDSNSQDRPRDAAVLRIQCNVEFVASSSCEVFLRVKDVDVRERSSSGTDISSPKRNEIKSALEEHWLRFAFENGVVKEVCPEEGEDKWTLNIKRGILSALQSPVPQIPQEVKQPMMNVETDVTGTCPVALTSEPLTGRITKAKNFQGCKDRTKLEGAIQAVKLSPYAPLYSIMDSTQKCEHSIHHAFMVRSSVCEERHLVRPFSKHETGVVTTIQQTLEYVTQRSGGYPPSSYMQARQTDILFEHHETETPSTAQDAMTQIYNYCESFTEDDKQRERPQYFSELVRHLNNIDSAGFQTAAAFTLNPVTCRGNPILFKKFFIDAVAMCESTACLGGMLQLMSTPDTVPSTVAEMWVSSLPFIQKPKTEMIPILMNLVKTEPIQPQTYLAVSSLIHNFCKLEGVDCSTDTNFRQALDYFENTLDHDCNPSGVMTNDKRLKLIVALKAIGNIGNIGDANYLSGTLTRCMQRTNDIDIRLAAIEAFRRLPCSERNELTNLYKNTAEDTELRIAAYLAMMQCASEETLETVVLTMENEMDHQVGSFVLSHLKNLNETSDPQKQETKTLLRQSEIMRRFSKDIRKMSRNYEVSWFNDETMLGVTFESNVIYSQKSFLPRSVMVNATADVFGYAINAFEIGGRMEGMQHMLESVFGPSGYFTNKDSNPLMQTLMSAMGPQMMGPQGGPPPEAPRNKRNVDQNRMENIINEFDVPQEDKPMASMYMKIFGNEIAFMDYDAMMEKLNEWKQSPNLMQLLVKLSQEQTVEASRANKIAKISMCLPTVAGLPMSLTVDGNSVTQVSVSGRLDIMGAMMAPRNLNIIGSIKPSIAIELSTTLEIDAFHTRTGLNHVARLHSDTILDGTIVVENGNSLRVKMKVPEEKQTIVDVSSRIYRLHQQDKVEILGNPETQYTNEVCSATLVAKYLGVRVCSDMTFPTVFTMPGSPKFLLVGPSSLTVELANVDPSLVSFDMELSRRLDREMVGGEVQLTDVVRFMVDTPGTQVPRTFQVDYSYNRNQRRMVLDLVSPWKAAQVETNVIDDEGHRKLDLRLRMSPGDPAEKAFRLILENEIEVPQEGVVRYVPRFEFTGPRGNTVQMQGSVINNEEERRTDIDIQFTENSDTLLTLNGPITRTIGIKKSNYNIEMNVDGRYLQGQMTGSVNRNKRAFTVNVDIHKRVQNQLLPDPWAAITVLFGSNREDVMFRLVQEIEFTDYPEYNYHFEIESDGALQDHENTIKLCYNGLSCDTDNKIVFVQNNTASYDDEARTSQSLNIRYNHPAKNTQYELVQKFQALPGLGFNWTCSLVDEVANKNLFLGEVKLHQPDSWPNPNPYPKGVFLIEMGTPEKFVGLKANYHFQETGRIDLVSTFRPDRERTTTVTFAYVPNEGNFDIDLDIMLPDQRELNIGSRLDYSMETRSVAFDFSVDRFGEENWMLIGWTLRDLSDQTKWEKRVTFDLRTPLVTLRQTHVDGGVKMAGNMVTSDVMLRYNPERPSVGVEFIFTNHSNEQDRHGEVELVLTSTSHTITLASSGGVRYMPTERVCDLGGSVNIKMIGVPGDGQTFGFETSYTNSSDETRRHRELSARVYAPNDVEYKVETVMERRPMLSLSHEFDFKWQKNQQGISWTLTMQNDTSPAGQQCGITADLRLPEQHLVIAANRDRRENFNNPSVVVTLNDEEKFNLAYTYVKTLQGPAAICNHNVNLFVNGKRVIWEASRTRVEDMLVNLATSVKHNEDTTPSLAIAYGMTGTESGMDMTLSVENTYMLGYDTLVEISMMQTPMGEMTVAMSMDVDNVEKMVLNFISRMEMPSGYIVPQGMRPEDIPMIMEFDIDMSFPAMPQEEILRNLALNLRTMCAMCEKDVVLRWGDKGQDQTISINQGLDIEKTAYSTSVGFGISVTHPFIVPLLYPTLSLDVNVNLAQPNSDVKIELTTADNKKAAIKFVYQNTSMTAPIAQVVEVIVMRSDKDDIKLATQLKAFTPEAILDMTFTCQYSADEDEHVILNTKLVNKSIDHLSKQAKELEVHISHIVSNIEVDIYINMNNDTRDISTGLESSIRVGTEHGAITLEGAWDKRDKSYTIHHVRESIQSARLLEREHYEVTLTGQLEDKSYGDHKIYEVQMMNDYNGERVPSFLKIDGRDMEIEYDINFNPEDRSDYMRFKVGYVNSSAILAKIDTRRGLTHTVNASVLVYLQAPKVLYTQINWHPQWPKDLMECVMHKWNKTMATMQRSEGAKYYSNEAMTAIFTQWGMFKGRNQDVPMKFYGLVGAMYQRSEPTQTAWQMRGLTMKTKMAALRNDIMMAVMPYVIQANTTWQLNKAKLPLVAQTVGVGYATHMAYLKQNLDSYNNTVFLPVLGATIQNFQQLNASINADIVTLTAQGQIASTQLMEKIDEAIENMQLQWVTNGVRLVTWLNQLNASLYESMSGKVEALKLALIMNPISVDAIRWGLLVNQMIPLQQWNETLRALYGEVAMSPDLGAIMEFMGQMKALTEQRRINFEQYLMSRPKTQNGTSWIEKKILKPLLAWLESYNNQQNYKLVKADLENGEIIVLVYLQNEMKNLQEMPKSMQERTAEKLQHQLALMVPIIQQTVRSQIMDPQLQEMGIYEAANILSILTQGNQNLTYDYFAQLQADVYMTKYWKIVNLIGLIISPKNWIPPYDATAMIVHNQHYMTFDRRYYEFAGRCTYLLAHDFLNGNFSIYVDYTSSEGDKTVKTLIVQQDQQVFYIYPNLTVTDGSRIVDLPLQVGNITIYRDHDLVKVHNSKGVTVYCTSPYEICHVSMSGWYYGQTAGLLGTYDYQANNDFTLPANEDAEGIDRFTRNWDVSTACGTTTNRAHKCSDTDPSSEKNRLCQYAFLNFSSPFRPLFDIVDPEPYYQMCVNDMCTLETEEERTEKICEVYHAYLSQNKAGFPVEMPSHCIKCQTSSGEPISTKAPVTLENPVAEADVVFVVEEKRCAEGSIADSLHDMAIRIDTELRRSNIENNRFALVGFGGEGVHDLPHPHTIDGALFNDATRFRLGVEALEFADDGNNDTLAAILKAANYPFRAGASKNIILISCSNCQYQQTSYSEVADTLIKRGIQFNMLMDHPFSVKSRTEKKNKSSKERIYGFDDLAVYTAKMAGQPTLKGDQALRKFINEPLNKCTVLATETNGSVFNMNSISGKGFQEVFVLRMVKYSQPLACQICSCIPNKQNVGETVCERCHAVTPTEAFFQAFKDRMGSSLYKYKPQQGLNTRGTVGNR